MVSEAAHAGAELPWKCTSRVAVHRVEPEGTQGPSTLGLRHRHDNSGQARQGQREAGDEGTGRGTYVES